MKRTRLGIMIALAALTAPWANAQSPNPGGASRESIPFPTATTPGAVDEGLSRNLAGTTPISITVALRLKNLTEAEQLLEAINTPGDPQYRRFLSSAEFQARFAPSATDINNVTANLRGFGLAVTRATATTLHVTGLPADMERAFGVTLHTYRVAAHGGARGYRFHAPSSKAMLPPGISGLVSGVVGLDSRPALHPLHHSVPQGLKMQPATDSPLATGNVPGYLTVQDFAKLYDVQPLYTAGFTGKGRVIGILTFASFTPADAFAYWDSIGLTVDPGRITISDVDGGPGAPSDSAGSLETTLDVEQSGGLAPDAKIIVYQAPNTTQGSVDLFAKAVDDNVADSVSISWGSWEWFSNLENSPVTDPVSGQTVGIAEATHELLLRAALQGQTFFAASGDGGAYDINNLCNPETSPSCSVTLTLDSPASDPAITAAGGTTLSGPQYYCLDQACSTTHRVNINREQAWGWDYLTGICHVLGDDIYSCGIFPVGSGGGVSILFARPSYQDGIIGIRHTQPAQSWILDGSLILNLPANYGGRNVPDISANADPDTGYEVYYSSDTYGTGTFTFYGGTSFVAPQLNGVTALLGEYLGGARLGLLNYALYGLAKSGQGYTGSDAPLRPIIEGDNWFYQGRNGYSPAAGLGTLDVANLARALALE